jgi:hypothetical protein
MEDVGVLGVVEAAVVVRPGSEVHQIILDDREDGVK